MTADLTSRRDFFGLAAASTMAATAVVASTGQGLAYQGNMERAVSALYDALGSLKEATPNKGGHREAAIQLVEQAISQVQAGIEYANEHGGG